MKGDLRIPTLAKGTRIILPDEAKERRALTNTLIQIAEREGFGEIILPSIEHLSLYADKAGPEVLGQMYTFDDKSGRRICLRPEGTATVQALAREHWKGQEAKVWYLERCYRYEQPQAGRYREFLQFGIEWLNPRMPLDEAMRALRSMADEMVRLRTIRLELDSSVKRGLSYYTAPGFEIRCEELGAQKQVCGGGPYEGGAGFAIGIDRLMLCEPTP
jgi:histidyl-tRNA synthetase